MAKAKSTTKKRVRKVKDAVTKVVHGQSEPIDCMMCNGRGLLDAHTACARCKASGIEPKA